MPLLNIHQFSWMIPILDLIYAVAQWVVPIVTVLLLVFSKGSLGNKCRLFLACVAVMLWVIHLDEMLDIQKAMVQRGAAPGWNGLIGTFLGRFLPTVATVALLLSFRLFRFFQRWCGVLGCFFPILFLIFLGLVFFLSTAFGVVFCPVVWLVTVLILLNDVDLDGTIVNKDSPIVNKDGPIGKKEEPIGNPQEPKYKWVEQKKPYEDIVEEPYTEKRRVPYTVTEEVDLRSTETHGKLLLHGDVGSLSLMPQESPHIMLGMRFASICSVAPLATAMLFTLRAGNKGTIWLLTLLPGCPYTLLVNGQPATCVTVLQPGMTLALQDEQGSERGVLTVEIQAAVQIVTKKERREVTKYKIVKVQRTRSRKVIKYRTERVRVPV